jgi:HK97 family phage portal protein
MILDQYGKEITDSFENPSVPLTDPRAWEMLMHSGGPTDSGVSVNDRTAMGYPPLWRAISLISGDVAKLPLNVYRRMPDNGKEQATKNPAWPLLRRKASPPIKSAQFKRTLTYHALLFGNGFATIQRDQNKQPTSLLIIHPHSVTARILPDSVTYSVNTADGSIVGIPSRDMLHIRGLSPDGVMGHSIIDMLGEALGVGMAAQRFGARFFGQGANAGGVLMIPGHFSEEAIANVKRSWGKMNEGLTNAHKVMLLQDGAKFQQLTVPPEAAQFLQTRNYEIRGTVANITGCPPHKLGDDSRTSHSSLEQENQSYLNECLDTWLVEWEGECGDKLLSDADKVDDRYFVEFNRMALLQVDHATRLNGYKTAKEGGWLSTNEIRVRENMPTIGEIGDIYYSPANWMPVGTDDIAKEDSPDQDTTAPAAVLPSIKLESLSQCGNPAIEGWAAAQSIVPEMAASLEYMVGHNVDRSLMIEAGRINKLAAAGGNFLQAVDDHYATWAAKASPWYPSAAVPALIAHAAESQRQLLDVAGASTAETLAGNVAELVNRWPARADSLTAKILELSK